MPGRESSLSTFPDWKHIEKKLVNIKQTKYAAIIKFLLQHSPKIAADRGCSAQQGGDNTLFIDTDTHTPTLFSVSLSLALNTFLLLMYLTPLKLHLARSWYNETPVLSAKIILWVFYREQQRDATDWLKWTCCCRRMLYLLQPYHRHVSKARQIICVAEESQSAVA